MLSNIVTNVIFALHKVLRVTAIRKPSVSSVNMIIRETEGNRKFVQIRRCKINVFPFWSCFAVLNPLTPNDPYSGRTAPLTSKRFILYIYSTNTSTKYFKRGIYSPFFLFKMQFVS